MDAMITVKHDGLLKVVRLDHGRVKALGLDRVCALAVWSMAWAWHWA